MLADIKHHYTTATVLTVGPRDFVLLKIKVGNLNGEKGTVMNRTCNPTQKLLHPEWG